VIYVLLWLMEVESARNVEMEFVDLVKINAIARKIAVLHAQILMVGRMNL
jgi:hypothetical protein